MIDLQINPNTGELLFDRTGDLKYIDDEEERVFQDLSILMNIDFGHNKQYPKLGIGYITEKNGNSENLTQEINRQSKLINCKISRAYIDTQQNLQIII
jgi:hypothetical protein